MFIVPSIRLCSWEVGLCQVSQVTKTSGKRAEREGRLHGGSSCPASQSKICWPQENCSSRWFHRVGEGPEGSVDLQK